MLLSRKGDYEYNMQSMKQQSSELCVVRQSIHGSGEALCCDDFVSCTHCLGFFYGPTLFKHVRTCPMKGTAIEKHLLASSRVLLNVELGGGKFRDVHELILSKMSKRDKAYILMKNDDTLLMFAATQLQMKEKGRYNDIKYSLRLLATLVLKYQEISKVDSARAVDLVFPENYDVILEAAKSISGYQGPRKIEKPNVFRKIGFCLSNLVLIVRASALKRNDTILIEKCRCFIELRETNWEIYAGNAQAVYESRKANIPEELPLEEDIKHFREYCVQEMEGLCQLALTEKFLPHDYRQLLKITLCRVMSFNARRGGEVSRVTLAQWEGVEDNRWKRRFDIDQLDDV